MPNNQYQSKKVKKSGEDIGKPSQLRTIQNKHLTKIQGNFSMLHVVNNYSVHFSAHFK